LSFHQFRDCKLLEIRKFLLRNKTAFAYNLVT